LIIGLSAGNIFARNSYTSQDSQAQYTTNALAGQTNVNTQAGTSASKDNIQGNVQIVKLHVQGSNYVLEPSSVKVGIPVRLEADISRMPGCSKDVVISAFGVRKYFSQNDNIVEFTPDKTGKIYIACSMNMYTGYFEVLKSDGTSDPNAQTQVQVQAAAPRSSGGSCGAGGGGCGCMG